MFIEREYKEKVTISHIEIFDGFKVIYKCKGIELPWINNERLLSCIPEGYYNVTKRNSVRYDDHFHLLDVPARDLILIHHGNFAGGRKVDTKGCILVGSSIKDINGDNIPDVTNSVKTMEELNNILPDEFATVIYKKNTDPHIHIY